MAYGDNLLLADKCLAGRVGDSFDIIAVSVHVNGYLGSRVRLNVSRLKAQCLPEGSRSSYVRVAVDGILAGNAFACRWQYGDRQVCWITQLVVHRGYRERNLATAMLLALQNSNDDIFGIMSSHPAACKALAKAAGRKL